MSKTRYQWASAGDINAFFGLMLDNIADLLLTVSLLSNVFGFPAIFALRYMVPGTAIGVLVGDLLFFLMALRLARKTGRQDVTAMPLGLDTPSTFGMVFFVLGPAFEAAQKTMSLEEAAIHTWHIGICSIFISGIFKFGCAFASGWVRSTIPRAGLLGSLAAVALVLISFLPLIEIFHYPLVGLIALSIILTTLVARVPFPGRIPGTLGALLVAGTLYYIMRGLGFLEAESALEGSFTAGLFPTEWLTVFQFQWIFAFQDTIQYLPVVIPFALATVVGGIDCTESAAAAGDEYHTGSVIGVEALATLLAAVCGGVIQTTPYIGHPAYKAMGGRAAYTLATALFVGGAGLIGYFSLLYVVIPKATVFPILVFIGLEITAQSFQATTKRHYAAVAIACVPALASLALLYVDKFRGELVGMGITDDQFSATFQLEMNTIRVLANGFIITSLIWASMLAAMIDRKLRAAGAYAAIAAVCCLFGVMHSPLVGAPIFWVWQLGSEAQHTVIRFTLGYSAVAVMLVAWGIWAPPVAADLPDESHESTEAPD